MGNVQSAEFAFTECEEKGEDQIENYVIISKAEDTQTPAKISAYDGPRRLIYYYPKENGQQDPVTLQELAQSVNPTTNKPYITHIEICTLHLMAFSDGNYIHLNDLSPSDPNFASIKDQISIAQSAGIKVC